MKCANPQCGHPVEDHIHNQHGEPQECLCGMFWSGRPVCWCNRFIPPREPLMAQLEAIIRSRRQLP